MKCAPSLAEPARPLERPFEDVLAVVAHQRQVVVVPVRRAAHERLRHERRDQAVLARDDPADLTVGPEVVDVCEGRRGDLIHLDLRLVLRVRVADLQAHRAAVLEQVDHDRLELLEVRDLVEAERIGGVLERAVRLLAEPHHLRLDPGEHGRARLLVERVLVPRERPAGIRVDHLARVEVVVEAEDTGELRLPRQLTEGRPVGHHRVLGVLLAVSDRVAPERRAEVGERQRVHADPARREARELLARDHLADRSSVDRRGDEVDGLDPVRLEAARRLRDRSAVVVALRPRLVVRRDRVGRRHDLLLPVSDRPRAPPRRRRSAGRPA